MSSGIQKMIELNERDESKKKTHWTKRPENRAKVAKMIAKGKKTAKKKKNGVKKHAAMQVTPKPSSENSHASIIPQDTFAYALGFIECWIETYAKSASIPSETFAAKLGKVLQHKNSR